MALSAGYIEFIKDQMSGFAPVAIRKMFGGAGVSHDGINFAIIVDEILYLKVDALNEAAFDEENLEPFSYRTKAGNQTAMSYRRAPSRLMDDADEMAVWCRKAYEAALRARKPKKS
jgi:DNA transformation protein and related proteins